MNHQFIFVAIANEFIPLNFKILLFFKKGSEPAIVAIVGWAMPTEQKVGNAHPTLTPLTTE